MSEFKGTPGTWEAHQRPAAPIEYGHHVTTADGLTVCNVTYQLPERVAGEVVEVTRIANARLIAAAPVLLGQHEADMVDLELLAKAIHAGDPMPELVIRVTDMLNRKRAAIAKATGEHP